MYQPIVVTRVRAVALLTTLALALGLTVVSGTAIAKSANAAVVIKSGDCTLYDGTGTLVDGQKFHQVINKKGTVVRCSAKGLTNTTGEAVHFNFANTGAECVTSLGNTTRWHETVSASGNARITCRYPSS